MDALTIFAEAQPEKADEFERELIAFMKTQAESHGNAHWQLSRDADNRARFVLYEEWPSSDVFDAFGQTEPFKAFVGQMVTRWLVKPPDVYYYRIVGGSDETKG